MELRAQPRTWNRPKDWDIMHPSRILLAISASGAIAFGIVIAHTIAVNVNAFLNNLPA